MRLVIALQRDCAVHGAAMREVEISREPTELFKILKFENLVASGGEAKMVVAEGMVKVNGEVDTRKRRKIVAGDVVEFGDETLQIRLRPR
ncbi:MAG: hypothetical protein SynsKO_14130 [Synoicihabitans sp.]